MTFEIVSAGYFGLIGILAAFAGVSARRFLMVMLTAFGLAAFIYAAAHWLPVGARLWIAPAYLAVGYWLPALLVSNAAAGRV